MHLSSLWTGYSPLSLHSDSQRSDAYGPLQGNHTPPVPGGLAYQCSVPKRCTTENHHGPDPLLQDVIFKIKSKHALTSRCLMSLIGLLTSTDKMVPEDYLHLRPFSGTSRRTRNILSHWTTSFLGQRPYQLC